MITIIMIGGKRCPPCPPQKAMLEKYCLERELELKTYYVEEEPAIACELQVMSTPTTIFFIEGKEVARHIGIMTIQQIDEILNK